MSGKPEGTNPDSGAFHMPRTHALGSTTPQAAVVLAAVVCRSMAESIADPSLRAQLLEAADKVCAAAIDASGDPAGRLFEYEHIGYLETASQLTRLASAAGKSALQEPLAATAAQVFDRAKAIAGAGPTKE